MIQVMRYSVGIAVAGMLPLLACGSAAARASECVHYFPEVVHLSGNVRRIEAFGPPNFGESPATDQRISVPILHLERPLEVCGDPKSDINPDTAVTVRDVQLIFAGAGGDAKPWYDHAVTVSGTLMASHTAYHHTAVVMTLSSIAAKPSR